MHGKGYRDTGSPCHGLMRVKGSTCIMQGMQVCLPDVPQPSLLTYGFEILAPGDQLRPGKRADGDIREHAARQRRGRSGQWRQE